MSERFIKCHNYTVTHEARQGLYQLFAAATAPSRSTLWARRPTGSIDAFGKPVYEGYRASHVEGLSHALISLARASDFDDWLPNPQVPMYLTTPGTKALFYNPPDIEYLKDATQDSAPWAALPNSEKQDRLKELARVRGWHPERATRVNKTLNKVSPAGYSNLALSLPNDIRRYYHNLRMFFGIPLLPGCRTPNSLTTSVGMVLEAIGTKHLYPSAAYLHLIAEPNPRKSYAARQSRAARQTHTYGNHAHTPYIAKEWRALPLLANFTQADVDYCYREDNYASLHDLAEEAAALNPSLILPTAPQPSTTAPVSGDPSYDADTSPTRAKPHIDLVPQPSTSTYHYKGRDVTGYILEAHRLHYHPTSPQTYPQLQGLADKAQLPLYMLRKLATREYVRRLDRSNHA